MHACTSAHVPTYARTCTCAPTHQVLTLFVHARDDPVVSHDDCYDWDRIAKNKHIITVRTDRGGHLGCVL